MENKTKTNKDIRELVRYFRQRRARRPLKDYILTAEQWEESREPCACGSRWDPIAPTLLVCRKDRHVMYGDGRVVDIRSRDAQAQDSKDL